MLSVNRTACVLVNPAFACVLSFDSFVVYDVSGAGDGDELWEAIPSILRGPLSLAQGANDQLDTSLYLSTFFFASEPFLFVIEYEPSTFNRCCFRSLFVR